MIIQDGTAKFIVDDVRDGNCVGDVVFRPFLKDGYIKANGAVAQRADYPRLIAFADKYNLWTDTPATEPWKFGTGDGSTTFVLPDYRGRVLQGGDSAAVVAAGLPNITGVASGGRGESWSGAFKYAGVDQHVDANGSGASQHYANFNASWSNPIYGASTTVQPPAIRLIPQIKY